MMDESKVIEQIAAYQRQRAEARRNFELQDAAYQGAIQALQAILGKEPNEETERNAQEDAAEEKTL
jgi:hypothetical protein